MTPIILMAGSGTRLGSTLPKQFHQILGKKVYIHTLETFLATSTWQELVLVCPADYLHIVELDLAAYRDYPIRLVEGGATRQLSVFAALQTLSPKSHFVMVHDAVRPFVSSTIIHANIEALKSFRAVDTCIPSSDTIVQTLDQKHIYEIGLRSQFWRGQTPQSFEASLLLSAHKKAQEEGITNATDDCFLVHRLGEKVGIVLGDEKNMKITTEFDLFLAQELFKANTP